MPPVIGPKQRISVSIAEGPITFKSSIMLTYSSRELAASNFLAHAVEGMSKLMDDSSIRDSGILSTSPDDLASAKLERKNGACSLTLGGSFGLLRRLIASKLRKFFFDIDRHIDVSVFFAASYGCSG